MAAAGTNAAVQSLPRFLLPRLSWGGHATTSSQLIKAAVLSHGTTQQQQLSSASWWATPYAPPRRPAALSRILANPGVRRAFHATAPRPRDHHFDTLKFVQRLRSEGFTEEQSVAMMRTLNDVIEER